MGALSKASLCLIPLIVNGIRFIDKTSIYFITIYTEKILGKTDVFPFPINLREVTINPYVTGCRTCFLSIRRKAQLIANREKLETGATSKKISKFTN